MKRESQTPLGNSAAGTVHRVVQGVLFIGACCTGLVAGSETGAGEVQGESATVTGAAVSTQPRDAAPDVVPYLVATPSRADGLGTAALAPPGPVPVSWLGDFEIAFTVGESGVATGGFVMLQLSPWWGWTEAQTRYPDGPGYVEVATSFCDPTFQVRALPLNRVMVFSRERAFRPGETITFRYSNARVDKFAEAEELFQVFVDADGDGHSACISEPPTLCITAGLPKRLCVNAPSQVEPGTPIEVTVAPVDALGNWSRFPQGSYALKPVCDGQVLIATSLEVSEGQETLTFGYTPTEEGVYFFEVEGPSALRGRSNVSLCREGTPTLNLYFGDIHGHSRMSDGTGTPEDYYRYARLVSGLDIAALTDHVDHGTLPIKGELWDRMKKAANNAYEPGHFVTYLGYEWTNWTYGHRNVYFRDGDGPVLRSIDPESDTPQELWGLLEPFDAMTVAHHVGGGPAATDWSIRPGHKEWLVEICSIHGASECYGGEACIYRPVRGAFVRDALARGHRLGIIGSGDTHDGHPGQRSVGARVNGLVGVYCPELTRESVWAAFRRRQVYGTSGPKIILNFQVAYAPMGSEVTWSASKGPVPIALRAVCCDTIKAIDIIRNGKTLYHEEGDGVVMYLLIKDPEPPSGTSWYYARVLQEDGNMAWSSPVWVESD